MPTRGMLVKLMQSEIGGVPLLVIEGDLDQSSKQVVRDAVLDALQGPFATGSVLVDLTDCTFLDSGGISVLLTALSNLREDGWLGLVGASPTTAQTLTYAGLDGNDKVRTFSSTSDAAATLSREKKLG